MYDLYVLRRWFFKLIQYVIFVSCLFIWTPARADYVAFQNYPERPFPNLTADPQFQQFSSDWVFEFVATSTITQFDRLDVALCRNSGTAGGELQLEVRSSASTTGPVIASSTLAINDGNVYYSTTLCAVGGQAINATTSTFVLNNSIQTVAGVTWWIRLRIVNPSGNVYLSMNNYVNWNNNGTIWVDGASSPYTFSGVTYAPIFIGRGLGTAPSVVNQYGASSTPVICGTFDVGCYISTSLSFLFIPSESPVDRFSEAGNLGSTTPFSYLYQLYDYVVVLRDGTATTTSIIIPFNGNDLTIFDTSQISTYVSHSGTIRTYLGYMIWLLVLFVAFAEVYSIFHKKNDN